MSVAQPQNIFERLNNWIKNSITVKLVSIAFLILILLIPTSMIESLIRERQYTQEAAIDEVSGKWGNAQEVTGPIISVPYTSYLTNNKNELVETTRYAHFLPDKLNITGVITPEVRYRGIYKVVVYNTQLKMTGEFPVPDFKEFGIAAKDIRMQDASVSLGITDMRGIKENVSLAFGNQKRMFNPGVESNDVVESGISTRVDLALNDSASSDKIKFDLALNLNGSRQLQFVPLGKETDVTITSPWNNPSFNGAFLPDERNIVPEGFDAKWHVLHLNRNYPQQWTGGSNHVTESSFGMELLIHVDEYQKNMRSAKYAILLIALTFMIYFFVEVLNKKNIHPFQYILIGLALIIFYSLLLSLSEHIGFNYAYITSALAVISMVVLYTNAILRDKFVTGVTGLILVVLYGFIYSILQLQDYTLLMGSIGLFIILAVIMYLSLKIKWYHEEES